MAGRQDLGVALANALLPAAQELRAIGTRHRWKPTDDAPIAAEALEAEHDFGDRATYRHPLEIFPTIVFARCWLLIDYLSGLAMIASQGGQLQRRIAFSGAPVARAALETLAYIYWLSEDGIGSKARVDRLVRDLHHGIAQKQRLYGYRPADWKDWDPGWQDLAAMLSEWEISHTRQEEPPHAVVLRGYKRPSAAKIFEPLMKSANSDKVSVFLFFDLSDLAHASTEGILRRADIQTRPDGGTHFNFEREEQLKRLAAMPWALFEPLGALTRLMGWDVDRMTATIGAGCRRLEAATRKDDLDE